jgi:GTP-binding protein
MARLPKLAIVGRPNVGKSALFNQICKKRIAIVDEAEGVTRDRLYADAELFGLRFEVIDTGGIDAKSEAEFNSEIRQQALIAIEEADTIMMVVDGQVGMTAIDLEVAQLLREAKKRVVLAVNKVDHMRYEGYVHQFHPLGIPKMIPVSATQGYQIAELLEAAFEGFHPVEVEPETEGLLKIAIVGRPNVGKSTLVNTLLDEERCIVSPIAGTTRDSIDVHVKMGDKELILIDTAGIRKKNRENEVVDKFAFIRTERAIERADICLMLLDAQAGMTSQDKKIANLIEEKGKGCILLFNKWDLVKGFRMEHCLQGIREEALFLAHCPAIFISAMQGRNLDKIITEIDRVLTEGIQRITTGQLNKTIERCFQLNHPPMIQGRRLRVFYSAQVEVTPPKIVLFVNNAELMAESYRRYLYNMIRKEYKFTGMPLEIHLKQKKQTTLEERLAAKGITIGG